MSDPEREPPSPAELTRRELLKLAGGAAALAPLVGLAGPGVAAASAQTAAPAAAAPAFFTAAEFRLLDELTELIIPTDEHSPGARAAKVADYVDKRLAEYDPALPSLKETQDSWKAGLASIDGLSREMNGAGFMETTEEKRIALLERLVGKEDAPAAAAQKFFHELKGWTSHGYYSSKIGIHDEMEYKGNTLLNEYLGTEAGSV